LHFMLQMESFLLTIHKLKRPNTKYQVFHHVLIYQSFMVLNNLQFHNKFFLVYRLQSLTIRNLSFNKIYTCKFNIAFFVQKNIFRFNVSMNYFILMQVLHCRQHLLCHSFCLLFVKSTRSHKFTVKLTTFRQLQN